MSTDAMKPTKKSIIIIGAGISGIIQGAEICRKKVLKDPVAEMIMFDRSGGFGGVWYANTYPGAACDIASHIYSISWFPNHNWSRRYSPQDEIREYYDRVARYYNLHKSTAFGHTVLSAIWDDTTLLWNISVRNEAIGDVHYYTAPVVISAIGQLNRPKRARIPGADSFTGAQFHTAEWEHSDLTGKRVAIIGTGPSAGQIIPSIAPQVKSLHVYQRSPPHVLPRQDYEFSAMIKAIFRWVPFVLWFHHLYLYIAQEFMPYRSIHVPSKGNELATMAAKGHMESQIPPERQELRDRFRPNYAFGCKRPLFLDNYYPTFLRDNVTLTTVPPLQITKDSIITAEGEAKVDVIVWATGFLTQDMLGHIDIRGHQGISLRGQWGEHASAYLGTSTHNFPNFLFVHGPATGLLWGSLMFMFETESLWNVKVCERIFSEARRGRRVAFAVKEERERNYNVEIQEKLKSLAFSDQRCTSFYKNSQGVVTTIFPWRLAEYWRCLLWVEWVNYEKWELKL